MGNEIDFMNEFLKTNIRCRNLKHGGVDVEQRGGDASSGLRLEMIEFGDDVGRQLAWNGGE